MKVLFVIHRYWPYPGGAERYVQEMAERLVRDGHRASVVTTDAWDVEYFFARGRKRVERGDEVHNGVPVTRLRARLLPFHARACRLLSSIPSTRARAYFSPPSPLVPSLRRELEKHRDAEIVHFCALPFDSLMYESFLFARRHRVPYVITPFIHFGEPWEARGVPRRLRESEISVLARSDLVIVPTGIEKSILQRIGVDPGRVAVLGVGVNPAWAPAGGAAFRKRHGIPAGATVILHVAEKTFEKGSMHLVEAVKRLLPRHPGLTVVLAGGGSLRDFTRYMAQQEKETLDACVLLGAVSEEEKREMFAASDIYAMPSKTDTFGIVFLEAWLAGKPVIGAFAGGVPEVIEDGVDGFLVPFGDVPMLAGYLLKLIRDPGLRERMGEHGRRKVLASCTWETKYRLFKGLLERTAAAARRASDGVEVHHE